MRGGAVVHSQSALIGGSLHETTLVRSAFRIKRFQILHEEIADDRLRLTADIEQEEAAAAGCAAALPLQNIAYAWEGIVGGRTSDADDQAGMVLGAAIGRELRASAASYLQTPALRKPTPSTGSAPPSSFPAMLRPAGCCGCSCGAPRWTA
jgi:hypothetical protein